MINHRYRWLAIHGIRQLIGSVLARYRLHRIRFAHSDGIEVVIKTRRSTSALAVLAGNFYLRLQRSDVEVLSQKEWLRWENAVKVATNAEEIRWADPCAEEVPGVMVTHRVPGSPLRNILKDECHSQNQKFLAIGWALDALRQLRSHRVNWGKELVQSISHGDATVNNVIINFEFQTARWIDFDIRHLPQLSATDREADDLRALIYSSACYLPMSSFPRLANVLNASINDRSLRERFRERLAGDWSQLNIFQLAQAPLSWAAANSISQTIWESLQ